MTTDLNIESIEDALVAAGIVEDSQKMFITGAQLKKWAPQLYGLMSEIEQCHAVCDDIGLPKMGEGMVGLLNRIQSMQEQNCDTCEYDDGPICTEEHAGSNGLNHKCFKNFNVRYRIGRYLYWKKKEK